VDRDDVASALDAFVYGGEHLVGSTRSTAASSSTTSRSGLDQRWVSPDGAVHASAATILVSNNPYLLGHAIGSGTRPRIDAGSLGVAVVAASVGSDGHHAGGPLRQWAWARSSP